MNGTSQTRMTKYAQTSSKGNHVWRRNTNQAIWLTTHAIALAMKAGLAVLIFGKERSMLRYTRCEINPIATMYTGTGSNAKTATWHAMTPCMVKRTLAWMKELKLDAKGQFVCTNPYRVFDDLLRRSFVVLYYLCDVIQPSGCNSRGKRSEIRNQRRKCRELSGAT